MNDSKKLDFKKIFIIVLPVIAALLIFILFFKGNKESLPAQKQSNVLPIPDSESENVPKSKSEIYSQEKKEKREKERENEESKISTSEFFSKLDDEDNGKALQNLTEEEKEKRINQLFAEDISAKTASRSSSGKNKWVAEEVEDPLANYDFEKMKKPKSQPVRSQQKPEPKPQPLTEEIKPTNIPGKRTRNNSISKVESLTEGNLIPAVIHSDQTVKNGSRVKIRLLKDFYIEGQKIRKNTFVFGVARFSNERVDVIVSSIRMENNYIPFNKIVFDKDGLKGLYDEENAGNEMSKEVGSDAIDEAYDIATSGTGIVGSVLSAGKSVLKKKNTERKTTLKANSNIYLK